MSELIDEKAGKINLAFIIAYILKKHGPIEVDTTEMLDLLVAGEDYEIIFEDKDDQPGTFIVSLRDADDD